MIIQDRNITVFFGKTMQRLAEKLIKEDPTAVEKNFEIGGKTFRGTVVERYNGRFYFLFSERLPAASIIPVERNDTTYIIPFDKTSDVYSITGIHSLSNERYIPTSTITCIKSAKLRKASKN